MHNFCKKITAAVLSGIFLVAITNTASATVVEDFESGNLAAYASSTGGVVSGAYAHDGAYGLGGTDSNWVYRTDSIVSAGDILSVWINFSDITSGRAYFGFGADAGGTQSFVLAANTGDIRFQDNYGYGYTELDTSTQTFASNYWYRAEVIWDVGGAVTGNLYGSDGLTLLNSVSSTVSYSDHGGLAFRGFGGVKAFDTVEVTNASVPESSSMILMSLGLLGLGFFTRRKA